MVDAWVPHGSDPARYVPLLDRFLSSELRCFNGSSSGSHEKYTKQTRCRTLSEVLLAKMSLQRLGGPKSSYILLTPELGVSVSECHLQYVITPDFPPEGSSGAAYAQAVWRLPTAAAAFEGV